MRLRMQTFRHQLDELRGLFQSATDLFICSASFESRCRAIPDHLNRDVVRRAIIFENVRHKAMHGDHANYLLNLFQGRSELVMLDNMDPLQSADAMVDALHTRGSPAVARVLCDITTFTHESVLILFKIMALLFRNADVWYLYATAGDYSVGDPAPRKWLSKGVDEVRSVLGYPGEMEPSRRLHLIVLAGFEHERIAELIRRFEPSKISLGCVDEEQQDAAAHMPAHRYGADTL